MRALQKLSAWGLVQGILGARSVLDGENILKPIRNLQATTLQGIGRPNCVFWVSLPDVLDPFR